GRIGEVDATVRLADDVVRAVELLALIVSGERDDAAIRLGPRDLARGVLAGQQATLPIVGEAVRLVARLAERGDAVGRRPAPHVIGRHVAEEQELAARMPQGSLGEEKPGAELLEARAHFLPGVAPTYQSGGVTSLNTTQIASRGTLQTSEIASVTRLAT